MLNAGGGGSDPSSARPFPSFPGAQSQGNSDASFPAAGGSFSGLQGGFGLQGQVPGSRPGPGFGGMSSLGGQPGGPGQGRFGSGSLSSQLQQMGQYGQAAGRGGIPGGVLPAMNGLGGRGAGSRGSPAPPPGQPRGSLDGGLDAQRSGGGTGLGLAGGFGAPGSFGMAGGGGGIRGGGGPGGSPARGNLSAAGLQQQPGGSGNPLTSGDLMSLLGGSGGGGAGGQPTSLAAAAGGKFSQAGAKQGGQDSGNVAITFDESDFPSLGGGPVRPAGVSADGGTNNPGGGIGAASALLGGPDPYGPITLGKGQEFNMQAEEFPALPGAPKPGPQPGDGNAGDAATSEQPGGQGGDFPGGGPRGEGQPADGGNPGGALTPGHPNYEQMMRLYQEQQQQQQGGSPSAAFQAGAAGSKGVSPGGQPDRFGLLGLLSVIRMTDPDLTTLALGTDLTTLGLDLNSAETLHKTFASPWADGPLKAEPDFKVPACYLHAPPRLQPGYFAKFQQDTLFYIFYSMPGDEAQLLAADELSARQWWFHKEFKLWLTRIPNTEPIMKTERFERGSYLVFDTATWDAVRKDNFVVHYDSLAQPPALPRPPAQGGTIPGAGPGGASALKPAGTGAGLAPGSAL